MAVREQFMHFATAHVIFLKGCFVYWH